MIYNKEAKKRGKANYTWNHIVIGVLILICGWLLFINVHLILSSSSSPPAFMNDMMLNDHYNDDPLDFIIKNKLIYSKNGRKTSINVLIDWGANCGNSYELLMDKIENRTYNFDLIYLFDANPLLYNVYLKELEELYPFRIKSFNKAVWISKNLKLTFYLDNRKEFDENNDDWMNEWKSKYPCRKDSDLNPFGASSIYNGNKRSGKPITIPSIDSAQWLYDTFNITKYNKYNLKSFDIILKIDIEGAEYKVMDHLIKDTDAGCLVNKFYMEWHTQELISNNNNPDIPKTKDDLTKIIKEYKSIYGTKCNKHMILKPWH